jgi:hypothetical protein
MKKLMLVLSIFIMLVAIPAFAIEAHWDFGTPAPDNAWGYKLKWGLADGVYTQSQDILKSACVAGTDALGAYDCKTTVANTGFIVGTHYFFEVVAWAYSQDGTTQIPSTSGSKAQYVHQAGGTTGVPPKPPAGLGIYPTAQ